MFHGFRNDFNMDETCATASEGRSPYSSIASVADNTNMFKNAGADVPDTLGVETSNFCAANKTTRYKSYKCKHSFTMTFRINCIHM